MSADEESGAAAMETEETAVVGGAEDQEEEADAARDQEADEEGVGGAEAEEGGKNDETAADGAEEEGGQDKEETEEAEDEDPVFAQRDKLRKYMEHEPPNLESAYGILDALFEKWENVEPKQIVLGAEQSLGMLVRRLRKHSDEEIQIRAGRLYDMYRIE